MRSAASKRYHQCLWKIIVQEQEIRWLLRDYPQNRLGEKNERESPSTCERDLLPGLSFILPAGMKSRRAPATAMGSPIAILFANAAGLLL
jgi:hypothetical protein